MLIISVILTALSCALPGLVEDDGLFELYWNVTDKTITISEFPVSQTSSSKKFDVKKVSIARSKILDSSLVEVLGPELIPDSWKSYRYYFYKRIHLRESVNSYIIYAVSTEDERDVFLFLINSVHNRLKSISTLSHDYFFSWNNYGHTYSTIDKTRIGFYENITYIDDERYEDNTIRVPILDRVIFRLKRLFEARNKDYTHIMDLEIDNQGYLHKLASQSD